MSFSINPSDSRPIYVQIMDEVRRGMAAGALVGMTVAEKRKAMKTCVGRTMQQMGTAVDGALSDLMHR